MRWLVVAIFLFGLLASFAWYDADNVYTIGQRTLFGIVATAALAVVIVMGAMLM
jgi:hypothetical protein